MGVNCIVFAEIKRAFKSSKKFFFQSCFAADDFAPSQKLQRQRIFCSSQSIEVNRSYIVGKKVGVPKVLNIIPPKKTYIHKNTHIPKHTHTHTQSCMRGGRSKWLGGGGRNIMCCAHYHDSPCYLFHWTSVSQK